MNKWMQKIMQGVLNRLTAPCEVITAKVSENLDHPLPLKEKLRVRAHLQFCRFCRRYAKQISALRQVLQTEPPPDQEKLPGDAKDRIKRALGKNSS